MILEVLLLISTTARAASQRELNAQLSRIQANQLALDQGIAKFGVRSPDAVAFKTQAETSEEDKLPLFRVHESMAASRIPAGKLLFGRTYSRLIVGPEASPSLILLDPDQGAFSDLRIVGIARQSGTPGRLGIEIQKLLLRSGKAVPVQGQALDLAGAFGLEAQVVSQKVLAVGGAMASSFVAGLAASQQTQSTNAFGFQQTQTTGRNSILQGVAQTAADQSKRLIDEATSEKPILIVEPGTAVSILFQEEVRY